MKNKLFWIIALAIVFLGTGFVAVSKGLIPNPFGISCKIGIRSVYYCTGSINVKSPLYSETWRTGDQQTISWKGIEGVQYSIILENKTAGIICAIAYGITAHEYTWNGKDCIPGGIIPPGTYKLLINGRGMQDAVGKIYELHGSSNRDILIVNNPTINTTPYIGDIQINDNKGIQTNRLGMNDYYKIIWREENIYVNQKITTSLEVFENGIWKVESENIFGQFRPGSLHENPYRTEGKLLNFSNVKKNGILKNPSLKRRITISTSETRATVDIDIIDDSIQFQNLSAYEGSPGSVITVRGEGFLQTENSFVLFFIKDNSGDYSKLYTKVDAGKSSDGKILHLTVPQIPKGTYTVMLGGLHSRSQSGSSFEIK